MSFLAGAASNCSICFRADAVSPTCASISGYEVSNASLRFDPGWDPLRADPRFQKLIADAEAAQAKIKP